MAAAGINNQRLATAVGVDPAQVSRWRNGRQLPMAHHVRSIEAHLSVDLSAALAASAPEYELYVSAPITGLASADIAAHHGDVAKVVAAAEQSVPRTYWPGRDIESEDDLQAPWIATERNMQVLEHCAAFLYVQLGDVIGPSSALVELGIALGRRVKVTVIVKDGVAVPFMFRNFESVAQRIRFLPDARIIVVRQVDEAVRMLRTSGRVLFGLAG